MLPNRYYKIKTFNPEKLLTLGYRKDYIRSEQDCIAYTLRFCVYKYGIVPMLDANITVYEDKEVVVDCYNHNYKTDRYCAFYCHQKIYDDMMKIILKKINRELKKIGAKYDN